MVAIVDMEAGRAERQRMVTLAMEQGWIDHVQTWATERMDGPVVVVLATRGASPPGRLRQITAQALAHWHGPGNHHTRRAQRAAGLPSYVIFPLPLAVLCECVSPEGANDLREAAANNQYAVLCMNADREVLIAGVSPNEKEG